MMRATDYKESRRLHPFLIIVRLFLFWKRYFFLIVLLLSTAWIAESSWLGWMIGGFIFVCSLLRSYLIWYYQTYQIRDGELEYHSGIFNRKQISIPLHQIQTVDLVQTFWFRLIGLAKVQIETAGSDKAEVALQGIQLKEAEYFKQQLIDQTMDGQESRPIQRELTLSALFGLCITSLEKGVLIGVIIPLFLWSDRLLPEGIMFYLDWIMDSFSLPEWIILFVIGFWLLSVIVTFIRFNGFRIVKREGYVHIQRGLLDKRMASVPLHKIQAIRLVESWLRQPFGKITLMVEYAGPQGEDRERILFPMLDKEEVPFFVQQFLPAYATLIGNEPFPLPRRVWHRIVLYRLVLPIIGITACVWLFPQWGYYTLISLPLDFIYNHLCYRAGGFCEERDGYIVRYRKFHKQTIYILRHSTQAETVLQTPFSARAGLVKWRTYLASGNQVTSEWIDADRVRIKRI